MFVGAPSGWRGQGVLGFLVSTREATKGVRDAMGRSRWAMGWVMLESDPQSEDGRGKVRQVLWNKAASEVGLEGLSVTVKYDGADVQEGAVGKECVLMWQGKSVSGLDEQGQKES